MDSKTKIEPPLRATTVAYFALGALLLVLPLLLILTWGSSSCNQGFNVPSYCVSRSEFKFSASFLPFVMLMGGLIIGYKMKTISDSLKPPDEEDGENRESDK
jgi:hypothetical protein